MMEERDARELYQLLTRNRAHLRQWVSWVDEEASLEDSQMFVRHALQQYQRGESLQLGIRYQGQLAGLVGFHLFDWPNRLGQMAYWLGAEFQGKGLITSAVRVLIDYAFDELVLNRVGILCATGNTRSRAIPERLGFKQDGILRDAEWLYDHFVDMVVYSMLAREWKKG